MIKYIEMFNKIVLSTLAVVLVGWLSYSSARTYLCERDQERLERDIRWRTSYCESQATRWARCADGVAENRAVRARRGALLGAGLAVLTGGASLLVGAGAGAVVGDGTASSAEEACGPTPRCDALTIQRISEEATGVRLGRCGR